MTVTPDQTQNYEHASQALAANGYEDCGTMYGPRNPITGLQKKYHIYKSEATGKFYRFARMSSFHAQIFSIALTPTNTARLQDFTFRG